MIHSGWTGQSNSSQFLRFGTGSTPGRGAAVWNRLQIASRVPESDMTFNYLSSTDSYELVAVADVLGHLHIPDTFSGKAVTEIRAQACSPGFTGHKNLVSLRLPESLTSIGNNAFSGCSGFTGSLTLPNSLTSIDFSAFFNCHGFTGSLTLPASLTSIGSSAFRNCSGFDGALTLPESLTSIGNSAFAWCSGFSGALTIPASVTSIDHYAFESCSGLDEICWLGAPPATYGTTPFRDTSATHYVPSAYLSQYQALAGLSGAVVKVIDGESTTLLIARDGSQLIVTFLAHSGYSHQPEVSTDVESWSHYGTAVSGNDATNSFIINPADADWRYFRVQSTPQQ